MDEQFIRKIIALRGDHGKQWLNNLPEIIKRYEHKWEISCFPPFPLSYNYVAPAKTHTGKNVVLKLSFPENQEFPLEFEALRFYRGHGSINVLQADIENGAMLLEKAEPGTRVHDVMPDEKQISIVSNVLRELHKPISNTQASLFPTISDWAKAFDRYKEKNSLSSGPVPKWMFDKAKGIFSELVNDNKELVLLHGDLHNDNILSSERGWLVIDPKGLIGERTFELGAFLRNPLFDFPKNSEYKKLEIRRILQFSEELNFETDRILAWAFASAVISLLWFLEDEHESKDIYLANAELLNEITL